MIWQSINQGSNMDVTKMNSIFNNVINCCTGFIANSCGEIYSATEIVRGREKLSPHINLWKFTDTKITTHNNYKYYFITFPDDTI